MRIRQWLENKWLGIKLGIPVEIANDGKPIEVITIQYKDVYFFVDIDSETQEPTGGFGWSQDPTMNPTIKLKDILVAEKR